MACWSFVRCAAGHAGVLALGRRSCLVFSALLYVLGAGLQLVDIKGSLAVFDVGRLLNGLGVGTGTLVSPM